MELVKNNDIMEKQKWCCCFKVWCHSCLIRLFAIIFMSIFRFFEKMSYEDLTIPVDTGRKLNVHKTFRRHPGRLLNVLCTFNLRLALHKVPNFTKYSGEETQSFAEFQVNHQKLCESWGFPQNVHTLKIVEITVFHAV